MPCWPWRQRGWPALPEATVGWGGILVLSLAVGLLAAHLLLKQIRWHSWRLQLATGAVIAAVPLVHGIGGGTWIYCAGFWVVVTVLTSAKSSFAPQKTFFAERKTTLAPKALPVCSLFVSFLCAGSVLVIYRLSATIDVGSAEMERTREFVQQYAPAAGEPWLVWLRALGYVRKDSGTIIVLAGWGACLALACLRQWRPLLVLVGGWLTVTTLVANSRWYVLPASFLLYPSRVIYWSAPLGAVGLALAWRKPTGRLQAPSLCGAVWRWHSSRSPVLATTSSIKEPCREDFIDRDGWDALVWAKGHLDSRRDFVEADYNSAGSYLPAVAQIACTGSHYHHFAARQTKQAFSHRRHTHQFVTGGVTGCGRAVPRAYGLCQSQRCHRGSGGAKQRQTTCGARDWFLMSFSSVPAAPSCISSDCRQ